MGKIDFIIASAGTRKTTHLVELIGNEARADKPAKRLLGTTFTVKAADELVARARGELVKDGDVERATGLLAAGSARSTGAAVQGAGRGRPGAGVIAAAPPSFSRCAVLGGECS